MSAEQMTSLMQRKARTGRDAHAARAMSLGRALRLTAAKQAEQLMGLALNVLGVTRATIEQRSIRDYLGTANLLLLLDGPNSQVGLAVLDPPMVAGLLQQQIMGKIKPPAQIAEVRRHTATDAALCAPFVEALLSRAALLPDEEADCDLLKGYRFGVWSKESRQAELVLDAADFEAVEITFDMAAGASTGKMTLILPHPVASTPAVEEGSDVVARPAAGVNLSQNVLGLHADLTIALTRLKMPLQKLRSLKPGDTLDLNLSSMAQALVIDANGRAISRGTLGQIGGFRAVQVEQRKGKLQTQPRRRAADRDELDLPDVTQPLGEAGALDDLEVPDFMDAMEQANMPTLSDMDVFGDLDDLPELPDMDEAADAADAKMVEYDRADSEDTNEADPDDRRAQVGW